MDGQPLSAPIAVACPRPRSLACRARVAPCVLGGLGSRRAVSAAFNGGLQPRSGREPGHPAGRDLDALARLRVHALAGAAVGDRELPEAGEADLASTLESGHDDVEEGIDRLRCVALAEARLAGDLVDEFLLRHVAILLSGVPNGFERNSARGRIRS